MQHTSVLTDQQVKASSPLRRDASREHSQLLFRQVSDKTGNKDAVA